MAAGAARVLPCLRACMQLGMGSAVETLCGQAYGARLYRMLGLYLQSSLIMSAAVSVLVSALWCFTEPVLVFLRQDPEVSRAAASFVRCQIPGLFAFSFLLSSTCCFPAASLLPVLSFLHAAAARPGKKGEALLLSLLLAPSVVVA